MGLLFILAANAIRFDPLFGYDTCVSNPTAEENRFVICSFQSDKESIFSLRKSMVSLMRLDLILLQMNGFFMGKNELLKGLEFVCQSSLVLVNGPQDFGDR